MVLSTSANAGFWSSVVGGVVANSLTSSGSNRSHNIDAKSDEKKVQQVLTKLGFYNGKIDGKLNSFETRAAIEEFQKYYLADPTVILTEQVKQDILYMHDLFKNYKQEYINPKKQDSNKLIKLYQAFDKIEDKIRNNNASYLEKAKMLFNKPIYISSKLKKDILEKRDRIAKKLLQKKKHLAENSKKYIQYDNGTVLDTSTNLQWKKCLEGLSGENCENGEPLTMFQARLNNYAKKITFAGYSDWRIPTLDELNTLVYCSTNKRKNIIVKANGFIKKEQNKYLNGECALDYDRPTINTKFFPNSNKSVWTSNYPVSNSRYNYIIDFYDGKVEIYGGFSVRAIRLVRGKYNNRTDLLKNTVNYDMYSEYSSSRLNSILWEMHERKNYSRDYKKILNAAINNKPNLSEWDTIAWVYKDNGNKMKAIEIYKTKILPKSKDKKWKTYFEQIKN